MDISKYPWDLGIIVTPQKYMFISWKTGQIQVLYTRVIWKEYRGRYPCVPFGPLLAPPEGLRAPGVPGVNPGGRPQESGGDSKAI